MVTINRHRVDYILRPRRLRQLELRGIVTDEVVKLVTSLVLSRLDYCNSVLFGLRHPLWHLNTVQRVQNVAAPARPACS